MATILGTPNNDSLLGTPNSDEAFGLAGQDSADGAAGNDFLDGGDGSDTLSDLNGNNAALGNDGNDVITGGSGNDVFYGSGRVQLLGLTNNNQLVSFAANNPTSVALIPITGVEGTLLGIDLRPANGRIYGISTTNKIYTIDPTTGVATFVSTLSQPFTGGQFSGFDFNPVADRLRVVGANDQNFRINVDTGAVTVDGTMAYAAGDANVGNNPEVTAVAYTNSVDNAATTQLYDIDAALNILTLQNPPNNGSLGTVGNLGFDFASVGGFDILSFQNGVNVAFAVSNSTLYAIDLATGTATSLGQIGNGTLALQGLTGLVRPDGIGNNILNGGGGNDVLIGGLDSDVLNGEADNDVLDGGSGTDTLKGGDGNDALQGGDSVDNLLGEAGKDLIEGADRGDNLRGGSGDDIVKGGAGRDALKGDANNDLLLGGQGADTIRGGGGNDTLDGDATLQFWALTDTNTLVSFDPNSPAQSQRLAITGVDGSLLGIDLRPADGLLYGVSTTNRVYTIDPDTGAATLVSTLSQPFTGGSISGFDFNPVADRLRLVGDNDQNFRIDVATGAVTIDGALAYAAGDANAAANPSITAAAYTNAFAGATATQLFDLDGTLNTLALQDPPNDGALKTIGALGADFDALGGFDILSVSTGLNAAFAVSDSVLYSIDLATGAATNLGQIGGTADNLIGLTTTIVSDQALGRDTLRGGNGDDSLKGGNGRDTLIGGGGNDRMVGDRDRDTLNGGQGDDVYVFESEVAFADAKLGVDIINGFGQGDDQIVLDQTTFGRLRLNQIRFVDSDQAAVRSAGRIVYSESSGSLYFNQNGSGNGLGDGGRFAQLSNAVTLTRSDFTIVA